MSNNIIDINIKINSVKDVIAEIPKNARAVMVVAIDNDGEIHCLGSNMSILEIMGAMDAAKMHIWEVTGD